MRGAALQHGCPHHLATAVRPRSRPSPPALYTANASTVRCCSSEQACRKQKAPSHAQASSSQQHALPSSSTPVGRRACLAGLAAAGAATALGPTLWLPPAAWAGQTGSQEAALQLEQRVSEFRLANGLTFLVLQRHNAPICACHTHADVGAFDEEDGQTGLAHLLEHMAFKGTPRIGTKDYAREAPLLDALDEVFYSLRDAEQQGATADVKRLSKQFADLQRQADELAVPNEFGGRLERSGGVGLNATTSHDATKYFVSLPSNMLELWFALESERFQAPVWRGLYSEKRVVAEERRLRIDNSPLGRFQEAFAGAALGNNYRRPVIGYAEDVARVGRREVDAFFRRHYGPAALTIAIVGDVTVERVQQLAEKYFGGWTADGSSVPRPSPPRPDEALCLPEGGPGRLEQAAKAGPVLMQAYYRPPVSSSNALVLDIVCDLLSGSRTSRLWQRLVQSGRAFSASAVAGWPGDKHACALLLYGIPAAGRGLPDLERDLAAELADLAATGPSPAEVQRFKKAAKVSMVDVLRSNSGLAGALASYQAVTGSWRTLAADLALVEALKQEEVQQVAAQTFSQDNCFTGYVLPLGSASAPPRPLLQAQQGQQEGPAGALL